MRNCNINRGIRKWKQGVIISLMLLLSISFFAKASIAAEQKASAEDKTKQSVQVKLPDGLYLFQPKIIQMYKYSPEIKDDLFSLLFIVKNGRLLDPYPLAKKMGMQKFMKEYVEGKTFNVYVGTEMVGKLSNVKLNLGKTNACYYEPFSFDIYGSGKYEGKPLPGRYADKSIYALNNSELFLNESTVKAVAVPQSYNKSKKLEAFIVTEEDKTRAVKEVRRNFISEAMKLIEERLKKENRVISRETHSRLESIKAVDIDGNGEKDIIGKYALYVSGAKKPDYRDVGIGGIVEIFFILWDTGRIEKVLFGEEGVAPALGLGGLIDIDQDGIQELVVQVSVSLYEPEAEDDEGGKKIEILRRDSSGWKSIYRSMRICNQIN